MFRINKSFITGAALGFIAGLASRKIAEELAPALKPLIKEAIKASKAATAKIRESLGYLFESLSDLSAEATSEIDLELLKKKKKSKPSRASSAERQKDHLSSVEDLAI